jgi:hypothetical protein
VDATVFRLLVAIKKLDYSIIEQLVNEDKTLLAVKDKRGNTLAHVVAQLIGKRYKRGKTNVDQSSSSVLHRVSILFFIFLY